MTDQLQVNLFGSPTFLRNGRPVTCMPTRVSQALVIYLLHQRYPVERERLIDMFYQASSPKQASANFRSTLSRLRKELSSFLDITTRTVGINRDANIQIDAIQFTNQLATDEWEEALALYKGDFLDGFFLRDAPEFETWILVERERLRLLAIEGLQKLVTKQQLAGNYWAALQTVTQLLAIDPFLEDVQRTKMLLLARTGQRPLALQQYQELADLFAEELGIPVSAETTRLFERINNLKTPPPTNLTAATDQFIGRTAELATLTRLIAEPERRLITLFGIGGVGKTRLALKTGRKLMAENAGMFLDGLFFVSLVGLETAVSPNDLALYLLQSLGYTTGGSQPPTEQLITTLRNRELLLILDNFEHLVEENASYVAQLLQEAPHLKLLITSRERLNLVEETVFDIDGLPFSKKDSLDSDAAQLFVTHAQRHKFTFTPAGNDIPAISQMCQLLEGIPLGIELAAGSVRSARCAEIAQQIKNNLGALSSPLQNVPPRHRSLRAVFLHSWALLAPDLRPIYANLAIFPATFDAESAEVVAGAIQTQLDTFVDKALLKVENGRFSIHPILREFAAEQLNAEETNQLRNSHAAYFATFISKRSQTDHRPTYLEDLPDLVAAYDDLVPAWRWAISQLISTENEAVWTWVEEMRRPFIRLHFQRNWFYAARELYGNARQQLEDAGWHSESASLPKRLLYTQLLVTECNATRILGDVVSAIEPTEQAIPLLRQNVALDDLFDAYTILVGCNMQLRTFDDVPDQLEELEAIAAETNAPKHYGVYYVSHSYYADYMGETETSLAYAEQALAAFRSMDDTYYEAIVLDGIARRLYTLDRKDEALETLHRAYALAEENDQTLTKAFIQRGIASHYRERGELEKAESANDLGRQLFLEVNDQRYMVDIDYTYALIAYDRQDWAAMTRYLIASTQRALDVVIKRHMYNTLAYLSILNWQRGERKQAVLLYVFGRNNPEFTPEQADILDEAEGMLKEGLTPDAVRLAKAQAAELELESILQQFLREGLRWF